MRRIIATVSMLTLVGLALPRTAPAAELATNLKEGDLISAIFSDDPDVYIINEHGFKRLFLNPEIFKFYGHLGGFANVKLVTPEVRDAYITSGYFRNCEDNDKRVYGVSVDKEDEGDLHWVDTPGEQAVIDDPDFFRKVFCINRKEFSWYPKGKDFKSVTEVPKYERRGKRQAEGDNHEKIAICHKGETLRVSEEAVRAHLLHGDTTGPCHIGSPSPSPTHSPPPGDDGNRTPTPSPEARPSMVEDNFDSYAASFLWNQGGWSDVVNGESFIVQSDTVRDGDQAVQNDYHDGPALIYKKGNSLSNGRQSLYFQTNDRAGWTANGDGNVQIRITRGPFAPTLGRPYSDSPSLNSPAYHPSSFVAVTLRKDGHVTYYDPSTSSFRNFATFNDDEWTRLEIEWRSSDAKARYRVGSNEWTEWLTFYGGGSFTNFDTINLIKDNRIYYGSGKVYFDRIE